MSDVGNRSSPIEQGHRDPQTGRQCGWACGLSVCSVPDCAFPEQRCVLVQREREVEEIEPVVEWMADV